MPPCYPHTGCANPTTPWLVAVSPCILAGDGSRVDILISAMARAYFGGLIAAATWTDATWLCGGLALYLTSSGVLIGSVVDSIGMTAEYPTFFLFSGGCQKAPKLL